MTGRLPIRILGTGAFVPSAVRDNAYFTRYLDTSDEWIVTRTGIRERHAAAPDESTSTLATRAAQAALEDAGLSVNDVDLIVCATATGDFPFPSTASLVQGALGARNIPAFDVGAACAGFLHALVVAGSLATSGAYRRVLVIGAETLTRFVDPNDRATVVLFGDAAGAAVITRSDDPHTGILHCEMGCDGSRADLIWLPAGGAKNPASTNTVAERLHYMHMKGREVYKFAVTKMEELIDRALQSTGLAPAELKLVIPHQSNLRIIESVRERLQLPAEKMVANIVRYGNTSAASVIIGLHEARRSGAVNQGDNVLLIAIGAGLVWCTMVVRL